MKKLSVSDVVTGIFNFCHRDFIPADSEALHKAFFKMSQANPVFFADIKFKDNDGFDIFSLEIDNAINDLMFDGAIGLSGEKLENICFSSKLTKKFEKIKDKLTSDQVEMFSCMGKLLSKTLKSNESIRYKSLTVGNKL